MKLISLAFLTFFFLAGCDNGGAPTALRKPHLSAVDMEMRTDLAGLEKLCNVPANVQSVKWSTGTLGNDWYLVAVFKMRDEWSLSATVVKDDTDKVFVGYKELPHWFLDASSVTFTRTQAPGVFSVDTVVYHPSEYTKSPLLSGFLLNPSDEMLVMGLHTR
ncbi:hypothetical protein [Roseimaritima sediminicola]|uniref:hypothetical protein n=1 Tax=Roseimaritima sediminicola TaxID=2662066 RepID=UPI001298545B|nr:hypothetical protein [Roseimaritima sediminicola]